MSQTTLDPQLQRAYQSMPSTDLEATLDPKLNEIGMLRQKLRLLRKQDQESDVIREQTKNVLSLLSSATGYLKEVTAVLAHREALWLDSNVKTLE